MHCAGTIPEVVEERDQATDTAFIVPHECRSPASPFDGSRWIAPDPALLRQHPRRFCRPLPESGPLCIHPLLELRRHVGDMKPIQERTAVEPHGFLSSPRPACRLERAYVAPKRRRADGQLFLRPSLHHAIAEVSPQEPHRLPQRGPGVLLVELRPEQGDHVVTTMREARVSQGEIDEEGEPLDRKSTRLNSSHDQISYAVFCL